MFHLKRLIATTAVAASATSGAHANPTEISIRLAIAQSAQALRGELLRASVVRNKVLEGIAAYMQTRTAQAESQRIKEQLAPRTDVCNEMEMQTAYARTAAAARRQMVADQVAAARRLQRNQSTVRTLDEVYTSTNQRFCSSSDQALGICKMTQDSAWQNLAGADRDASTLFQSRSGDPTYAGVRGGPQTVAADSFIARTVYSATPPELLRGNARYEETPQSRAYVEQLRRYESILSMSAYSLNTIKQAHSPSK